DCMSFWQRAQPVLYGTDDSGIGERFQKRWAEILNLPPGLRRVSYESAALRQRVLEAFDAPEAGWKAARYHSPDVMIGATSAEAIRRGDYYLVLGEMHLSSNTLGASLFMEQHPAQDEFFRALEYDQPEPRIIPLPPKTWRGLTTRTSVSLISPKDIRLEVTSNSCGVETCETLNIGALVMEESDGELVVRTRDNSRRFDVMKAFGEVMLILAIDAFRMLPRAPRTPRVTIDRVVVCRESWAFGADEFAFANEKDEAARFLAARRWAQEHGMPRFVFVKTPVEVKPFYVDFASPIYVDIFAKMVRRTQEHGAEGARVSVSEMLPRADETWLPDADGERYTSELRLVAVDLAR
ncbi:MAG TPA: lantibiotic dehydratase, partial [Pyrinomonadaceae bacterium]|nr:lantibiotic dehydratase [Pyrinomonadaceae bacterium]